MELVKREIKDGAKAVILAPVNERGDGEGAGRHESELPS